MLRGDPIKTVLSSLSGWSLLERRWVRYVTSMICARFRDRPGNHPLRAFSLGEFDGPADLLHQATHEIEAKPPGIARLGKARAGIVDDQDGLSAVAPQFDADRAGLRIAKSVFVAVRDELSHDDAERGRAV